MCTCLISSPKQRVNFCDYLGQWVDHAASCKIWVRLPLRPLPFFSFPSLPSPALSEGFNPLHFRFCSFSRVFLHCLFWKGTRPFYTTTRSSSPLIIFLITRTDSRNLEGREQSNYANCPPPSFLSLLSAKRKTIKLTFQEKFWLGGQSVQRARITSHVSEINIKKRKLSICLNESWTGLKCFCLAKYPYSFSRFD